MTLSFENKVALVTGAGSGMGLATAEAFAAAGAAVALVDINEPAVRAAAEQLVDAGHKAITIACDVTDEAQVKRMVEETVSAFGRPMKAGLLARLRTTDRRRARKVGLLALGTLGCMLMVPAIAGVRLNDSPSLPIGLYVVTSDRSADLVEFCPTEPYASLSAERGYRSEGSCPDGGAPLMKPIVAMPGDTVEISSRGFVVNGKALSNSAPLNVDSEGRRLQHWPFGKYRVETGTVWVISSHNPRSFDSRYFGPVRENRIRHHLGALLTR